jgi:hypothetical protein
VDGSIVMGRRASLTLTLLGRDELALTLDVTFVDNLNRAFYNLIGLDVLQRVDFGLEHSIRRGHLGIAGGA